VEWEEGDPWLMDEYGGKPIEPRRLIEEEDPEDYARIGWSNFIVEPLVWAFSGYVLRDTAWNSVADIAGYWMVLFVMLPLRLLDTDRPRDRAFKTQYVALQLLALLAGIAGAWVQGGRLPLGILD
jgi:hypothetical protein